jgi:hypothetical protein
MILKRGRHLVQNFRREFRLQSVGREDDSGNEGDSKRLLDGPVVVSFQREIYT